MLAKGYRAGKSFINYILDRSINFNNLVLMDYFSLPWSSWQEATKKLLLSMGNVCLAFKQFPRLSVYKLCGNGWTIVYAGSDENVCVIQELFFPNGGMQENLGRVAVWNFMHESPRWLKEGADLVILELSPFYSIKIHAPVQFSVPTWIQQTFMIPELPSQLLTEKNGKGLRRVKKAARSGYTWQFTHQESDFEFFYRRMYLPHISKRHGHLAMLTPYKDLKRWFDRGGLVQVIKDGSPVAGSICYISNGIHYSIEGGILDADPDLFHEGIHIFNTWCEILWASEQGVRMFDFGGTRPWVSNGSYTHKKLWGANDARRKRIIPTWHFFGDKLPPSLIERINQIGFISEDHGNFRKVALGSDPMQSKIVKMHNQEERGAIRD